MKTFRRVLALWLVGNLLLCSGCSMLTAQGRRERAYARYVKKYSRGRVKQQSKLSLLRMPKIPRLEPSEPVESTQIGEARSGPESITTPASDASGGGGGGL